MLINLNCCRLSGGEVNTTAKIRNAAVVNATKYARGDIDVVKKREELQRRIEETRRKLQSVSNNLYMKKVIFFTGISAVKFDPFAGRL